MIQDWTPVENLHFDPFSSGFAAKLGCVLQPSEHAEYSSRMRTLRALSNFSSSCQPEGGSNEDGN